MPVSASVSIWHSFHMCGSLFSFLQGHQSYCIRARPNWMWPYLHFITSTKTLYLNKVTFTDIRCEDFHILFWRAQFYPQELATIFLILPIYSPSSWHLDSHNTPTSRSSWMNIIVHILLGNEVSEIIWEIYTQGKFYFMNNYYILFIWVILDYTPEWPMLLVTILATSFFSLLSAN